MKIIRFTLAGVVLAAFTGLAIVAQQTQSPGAAMVAAAQKFLGGLTDEQKSQATFAFNDKERTNWNFIPLQDNSTKKSTRKGLPLEAMTPAQKRAALDLVKAGTSEMGNVAAVTIMSLEAILLATEAKKAMIRNPEWYFFTIFGTPAKTGQWGWRVEGHHLSINFTMEGDQVVAATPTFFGANPAEIKDGPRKGHRTLAPVEDYARQLFQSLTKDQKEIAHQAKHFGEPGQKTLTPDVGTPVGLAASKLNDTQRGTLMKLLKSYTDRLPADVGAGEYKLAQAAKPGEIFLAFSGDATPGKGLTYRVHGPTFLVEFLNIQTDGSGNQNNHVHSNWRRIKGDFGL